MASEIMAVLALSRDLADMRERLGAMVRWVCVCFRGGGRERRV